MESAAENCALSGWEHERCMDLDESLRGLAEAVCEVDDGAAMITAFTVSVAELEGAEATAARILDHADELCRDEFGQEIDALREFDEWEWIS